jgi:hypothetical protein
MSLSRARAKEASMARLDRPTPEKYHGGHTLRKLNNKFRKIKNF